MTWQEKLNEGEYRRVNEGLVLLLQLEGNMWRAGERM